MIKKRFKIIGLLIVLFVFIGCEKDDLPCKKVVQGDFVVVE